MMHWRTTTPRNSHQFLTKGTELASAVVPNTAHRFMLCEVRTIQRVGGEVEFDREYCVRDAASVSDAEVRSGVRPRIVARFDDPDVAVAYCLAQVESDP